ncbi:sugar nucleotide-binding protein [Agromyces sp. NPDC057679]|uniref:sugar nucleotide-binding protein n=1 Tax=Agromyces sp. NPDC057679 TaxID=3346207 RepID=UPI00366B2B71
MSSRVLVLGATGMLGHTVLSTLLDMGVPATGTVRAVSNAPEALQAHVAPFEAGVDAVDGVVAGLGPGDYVVNCIGVIRHLMRDDDESDRLNAVRINSLFPYELSAAATAQGFHVIQIATDCVYSGARGGYDEAALHDATDVYGHSKSLGEVPSPNFLNLRASIIGPEVRTATSLLEWTLAQPAGASIKGFTDHVWNGVTTETFARIVAGLVTSGERPSGTRHLVPADVVTKDELVRMILAAFGRTDVTVDAHETGHRVDRTLSTSYPDANDAFWAAGGFSERPTIADMVNRLAAHTNATSIGNTQ